MCIRDSLDFNEVFFTDVRVPAENLVGPLNGGWGVANGSLGHERTMMWLGFADRIANAIADSRPSSALERDEWASTVMDYQALEATGPEGLIHPSTTGPYEHMNLDQYFASWFERYARSFAGTIAGGTSEIQRNIIAQQVLGLPRR